MIIKFNHSVLKLFELAAAGIILNIAGMKLAEKLDLGLFLDTFGTILVSVLAGYVPGIAVGFVTNLLGSGGDINEMYFGFISVLVAVFSAFFAQRGYYDKFSKVVLMIPFITIMTSFFGSLIEELVYSAKFLTSLQHLIPHIMENFSNELLDKSLAIISVFFVVKVLPKNLKEEFGRFGKMQAPLSPEIRDFMNTKNPFILSLRTKMVAILMGSVIFVAILISSISYSIYAETTDIERKRITDGIIGMVVAEINPKRVDEFLELGHHAEGYNEVEHALYRIKNSNSDIKYLYVYKIMEDGCHVVFDLDTADTAGDPPGYVRAFDESFEDIVPDLLAGRPIKPLESDDTFGYLLTVYKPVYDSTGHCVCYAGIDFSMQAIRDYGRTFIAKVIALFAGAVICILVLGLWFVENNIILPVNTMACCARNFVYDSEEAREQNIERIKELGIKTHDEIENLYAAFLKTTSDSMHYFENFKRAKIQAEVMHALAHKDAMTGLQNKTAYAEKVSKFEAEISAGTAAFAIIMIDVNFLKRVNDTYGHERGDEYLINAGKLACSVFGEENVYRVGGDEFVVVLDGENLSRCENLVANLRGTIKKLQADTNLEAWKKISAAVGVAYYQAGDHNADEVFKRADKDMYKNKLAMKAARRD